MVVLDSSISEFNDEESLKSSGVFAAMKIKALSKERLRLK